MTWTFDPLRAKNARLNLEHLGAYVAHYYPDFYGPLGGSLNGSLPTDRALATWVLDSARVASLAAGTQAAPVLRPSVAGLTRGDKGEPRVHDTEHAGRIWLELPEALDLAADFDRVLRWRLALRAVMMPLLASSYSAARFTASGYVLERSPA